MQDYEQLKLLQAQIDHKESQLSSNNTHCVTEETYAKSTLGTHETLTPGEQKILGIRWM